MKCMQPADAAVLADYWLGALGEAEEEALELHLFACEECGERLREVMEMAEGIRRLAREGRLRIVVSDLFLRRVEEEGLRVRQYRQEPGGRVQCTVTAEDDFLIARLGADLAGAERVDLCLCDPEGVEQMRMEDIPVAAGAGEVIYQESIAFAKGMPDNRLVVRLVGVGDGGSERVLGEYLFEHTRSMPGPGGG